MKTKAILVIDEPNECIDCPCYRQTKEEGELFEDCKAMMMPLNWREVTEKPSWCPLKPLPEKRKLHQYVGDRCYHCRFFNGEKSSVGIACTNPMKEWRTRTAKYKQPSMKACKMFERKQEE